MKNGLRIGAVYSFDVVVTEAMRAHFEEITVHSLYGTAAMLSHMEWASRQHLLTVLEPGEEGAGFHIELDHLAPTPIGATVRIRATVTGILPNRLVCQCEAFHGPRRIGRAKVVQAVLPVADLHARIPSPTA